MKSKESIANHGSTISFGNIMAISNAAEDIKKYIFFSHSNGGVVHVFGFKFSFGCIIFSVNLIILCLTGR